jgi:hypothetical protein
MARPTCFDLSKLENLAERIYHGQVVFFVGAGFSLDSEGLTGARLLLRLLARFDAWTSALIATRAGSLPAELAERLRAVLRSTFWLGADPEPLTTAAHAKSLAADYYRPNEWMCEAFGALLDVCDVFEDEATNPELWAHVHRRETVLLEAAPIWGRVEVLSAIEPRLLAGPPWGSSERGKALFLDTLGFADPHVMAGRPHAPTMAEVERSYSPSGRTRLRPRHEIIARWAREGLCRTLLTTNYDVLIEGAYRLSGFACRLSDEPDREPEQPLLLTELSHFARVGEAVDFFRFGHTHRSALVAKIHGCAECYRWLRAEVVAALQANHPERLARARKAFASYLPAVVFTFREIQNWRQDAWSRDLLATLLRTRSIVFCGYSTQDRVLHDAFRTAFEEIARLTRRLGGFDGGAQRREPEMLANAAAGAGAAAEASRAQVDSTTSDARAQRARAFFLGGAGALEFDALEVLRAASRAEGIEHPPQTHHPNYLQFFFEGDDGPLGFPGLDQMMRWLWHRTLRIRQQQCVEIDLRRAATYLLGHACPERERELALARLRELTDAETREALKWQRVGPSDSEFDRVVGWTDRFHPALLREYALGEAVLRRDGPGVSARVAIRAPWFYPPSEQPRWTAWGVVVELALRRMVAAWRGQLERWAEPTPCLTPGHSTRPAIGFSRGDEREPTAPRALAIVLTGFDRRSGRSRVRGAFVGRVHHWRLRAQTVPWWPNDLRALPGTPSAAQLWRWVVDDTPNEAMLRALPDLLGIERPVESGQTRPLRVA